MTKKKDIDEAFLYCRDLVARGDPDRYLAGFFAPRRARPAIWAILAFNQDIARVRDNVTDPNLGYIRLQWVREQIEGMYMKLSSRSSLRDVRDDNRTGGPVYRALASAIEVHDLPRDLFEMLIDAREFDLGGQGPDTVADLIDYADRTSTPLLELCARIILPLKGGGTLRSRRRSMGGGGDTILADIITPSPRLEAGSSPFQGEDDFSCAPSRAGPFQGEDDFSCAPSRAGPFQGEDDLRNIALAYALIGLVRASEFHLDTRGWHMIPPGENVSRIVKLARAYLYEGFQDLALNQNEEIKVQKDSSPCKGEGRVGDLPPMIRAMAAITDIYVRRIEKTGFDMDHPLLAMPPPFLALRVWARVRGFVFF